MDEELFYRQELTRLPGHMIDDDRIRYRVVSMAREPVPTLEVTYAQRSGSTRREVADVLAIIVSVHDEQKLYLSGWYDGSPVNYFFEGIGLINDPVSGRAYSLSEVAREMFDPPIEIQE